MKLLIHSTEFPPGPGGIGTQAWELGKNLWKRGWDVAVVSPQDYATEEEIAAFKADVKFQIHRITRAERRITNVSERLKGLFRLMSQWQPDAVIATGDRAIYGSAMSSYRHSVPWIAIEHGTVPRGWGLRAKQWAVSRADIMVAVSRFTQTQMLANGIRSRRNVVIPNGADSTRFEMWSPDRVRQSRQALGWPGDHHLLLTVGNVTLRKGQDIVIRALPYVLRFFGNVHYLIAGLPSKKTEFEQLANSLGVGRHVHFLGRVDSDRTIELMNSCDIFLMTSRKVATGFEGYGIAAVEAALCGKPSIVSDSCGLSEAIADGLTGLAVPEANPVMTAEAIIALLSDPVRRLNYGLAARERALKQQTWGLVSAKYHELLTEMTFGRNSELVTSVSANCEIA